MRLNKINFSLVIGLFFVFIIILVTVVSLFYTPFNPNTMVIRNRFAVPSRVNLFGTDQYGRDLLSRIMVGGQTTLTVSLLSVSVGMLIGISLGAVAGFVTNSLDELLMRVADGIYAFPSFLLALLAVTIWGSGISTIMIAIIIANIPIFMRITRANFLKLREMNYVEAAYAIGASRWRIVFKHLLPNSMVPLLVQGTVSFATAILSEASLSYLGIGVQPPQPSWGRMLKEAQSFATIAPWTVIFPGIAIGLSILGLNLIGDGINKANSKN